MNNEQNQILWEAYEQRKHSSHMYNFAQFASKKTGKNLFQWDDLYQWSIDDPRIFWMLLSEYVNIKWIKKPSISYQSPPKGRILGATWFPGSSLNYAANLLPPLDDKLVLVSYNEEGKQNERTSRDLHNQVAKVAYALNEMSFTKGDLVAGILINGSQAIEIMLATTSLGGIWTACPPEFGWQGIVERLEQVKPKYLFFQVDYCYNGKYFDCLPMIKKCLEKLPSIQYLISVPNVDSTIKLPTIDCQNYNELIHSSQLTSIDHTDVLPLNFTEMSFDDPLFVLFTSGTTGSPKCIVHGVGGTLLQHKKELMLHTDLKRDEKLLFFTTTGWMMWNWMVSALANKSCIITYDGSPQHPSIEQLWEICDRENIEVFGTSPNFMNACMKNNLHPQSRFSLENLKTILTTGSPLLPKHYEWTYNSVKRDLHLASISGGTDIISCFMLGNPLLPVKSGEIQGPGLGMNITAKNIQGEDVTNEKAELVCSSPFVSMPLYFLQDPDGKKYRQSYFEFFPNQEVWRHGDYIKMTPDKSVIVYGRSDATLNPGGVRIGTAEIYRCVENFQEITDSIVIDWQDNDSTVILLFIKLEPNCILTTSLQQKIKGTIRTQLSPRHVPARILQVRNIPYTRNGKKTELAVSNALHGRNIPNINSLHDPLVLEEFYILRAQLITST